MALIFGSGALTAVLVLYRHSIRLRHSYYRLARAQLETLRAEGRIQLAAWRAQVLLDQEERRLGEAS